MNKKYIHGSVLSLLKVMSYACLTLFSFGLNGLHCFLIQTSHHDVIPMSHIHVTETRIQPTCIRKTVMYADPRQQRDSYYGESGSSFVVREFSLYEDLETIVQLSSKALPERPDGIVTVAKYTSALRSECKSTEGQYERLARDNPATLFLRCFEEFENAFLLFNKARVMVFPTYDLFYGGNRVARIEGNNIVEVDKILQRYQLQNSSLDLFSEEADQKRKLAWGDGKINKDMTRTPRTTARFIPGYDWDKDRGFFDDLGDKFQKDWDKITKGDETDYGEWLPNMDDK